MEVIVCIKRVPETAEADIIIDKTGRGIEKQGLVFDINEWDNYHQEGTGHGGRTSNPPHRPGF
jgi:electron transfer flavoprotein beta subunit